MKLYEFLRHFESGKSILIFDIAGVSICKVDTKEDLSIELYDYDILTITLGILDRFGRKYPCQYIKIQK